eukprot:scaffold9342_cov126-Isochrysis_galbana.AAC.15
MEHNTEQTDRPATSIISSQQIAEAQAQAHVRITSSSTHKQSKRASCRIAYSAATAVAGRRQVCSHLLLPHLYNLYPEAPKEGGHRDTPYAGAPRLESPHRKERERVHGNARAQLSARSG